MKLKRRFYADLYFEIVRIGKKHFRAECDYYGAGFGPTPDAAIADFKRLHNKATRAQRLSIRQMEQAAVKDLGRGIARPSVIGYA